MSVHQDLAEALFLEGYNCAQAVFAAFCDRTGLPFQQALKISAPLGGGFARLREVCGAVSGMCLALGALKGYDDPGEHAEKARLYSETQKLIKRFETENGALLCRDLLSGSHPTPGPVPQLRTAEYYRDRPCARLVGSAARILDEYLEECGG